MSTEDSSQTKHENFIADYYSRRAFKDLTLIISGYEDASHMCDAIAADICREYTVHGKITKRGEELASVVLRAGNAILELRKKIP